MDDLMSYVKEQCTKEINKNLLKKLNDAANYISRSSRQGTANWVILPEDYGMGFQVYVDPYTNNDVERVYNEMDPYGEENWNN